MDRAPLDRGRPRLLHVLPGLEVGGAEAMLLRLLGHEAASPFHHEVLTLMKGGALVPRFEAAGVAVHGLSMRRGLPTPRAAWRLRQQARHRSPDLLVGWLYHGNLAASFASRGRRPPLPVVWNIRHTPDDLKAERKLTALLIRLGARWSGSPRAVIYNSRTSARLHRRLGYVGELSEVLPNGFDTGLFAPSQKARKALRRRLALPVEALLVGRIGRYHGMKGFEIFLEAGAALLRRRPEVHLLLAGRDVTPENPALAGAIDTLGLTGKAHLLGPQDDLQELLPGLDVFCSSSLFGEGFPNVVAEAMACGVPAVVTAVGDSPYVVGETGRVVAPGDPAALSRALSSVLELSAEERREMGRAARRRVEEHFSADEVFPRYAEIWRRALASGEAGARG